jgi:hypothetical protein
VSYNGLVPTILRVNEFRFFFFSNEEKEPPHIHVESNDNYAKFWLEPVQLAKSVGYNAKEISELRNMVEVSSGEFKRRWHEYFGH